MMLIELKKIGKLLFSEWHWAQKFSFGSSKRLCFIHYSTDYVFNGESKIPYTIADRPEPINKYGKANFWRKFCTDFAEKYYLIRLSSVLK